MGQLGIRLCEESADHEALSQARNLALLKCQYEHGGGSVRLLSIEALSVDSFSQMSWARRAHASASSI